MAHRYKQIVFAIKMDAIFFIIQYWTKVDRKFLIRPLTHVNQHQQSPY